MKMYSQGFFSQAEDSHCRIGQSKKFLQVGIDFVDSEGCSDPALDSFIPKLKKHLLPRIQRHLTLDLSTQDRNLPELSKDWTGVALHNNRIFTHQLMQVSYTTNESVGSTMWST
ncbi:hypothetical protein BKA70DRAFT_1242706 [Coprinopsis sp. MPI-PUGE-AT-0042]|nr:hypothetical protein BKA70DRAFT_1242706 [Coprinopsis sp. MPI-PUGE-AT-0042]